MRWYLYQDSVFDHGTITKRGKEGAVDGVGRNAPHRASAPVAACHRKVNPRDLYQKYAKSQ